ncbi:hypothetical protein PHYSODRAFT_505665 [Phytophthora sojae]|uniref:Uncharacterized protein n=1 Tax=Phytophthora sojae (strain P6497) TaxID=1094619 RepID=G4ZNF0_PHYSP|nr:hypothetical protein PHYSODRAFT_505665 [Phytophthora sojae]EGZ16086.1 hypothetical protein PHYSODRAFT_505665 [Phytophthora sojae]|eukprot:XP_009529835.1 hypothetical protein PHYSODRAFT_505665 [Phytophthora sojae]
MSLATPLTTTRRSGHGDEDDGANVLKSVRQYWEQLSVNERQQILFLDEPELVKQLYKLNLSLLCVGLMQRHLKTTNRTATDTSAANKKAAATRTYELLEAMEFMDIGTGILTVKTELAEDTDRLFTLVGEVLAGFLTSIHVLTESNFNKLFVTESETINTWTNYQRLIGMLVEQLILRSYVSYLEKEAAQQMEQLLLESTSASLDSDCQSNSSTAPLDEPALDADEEVPASEAEPPSKKLSGLNPNALVFQPQESFASAEDFTTRTAFAGKRKFDEYVISVPLEDVISDTSIAFDSRSVGGDSDDEEVVESVHDRERRRWRKQRRREEDAKLEWQLQQVYASTSSLFGWDFTRQRELPDPAVNLPWSESTLWRTAPKEVVRYFSPGNGDAYSRFQAPHFLPAPSGPPPSRYYFNPGPPMPFGPPLLPPPSMEPMPPHLQGAFSFQPPEFPTVVSSPDFSNAQYHPSNHEDQVDV